ncbi:putative dynein light chain, cytoplasmic-like [Capsicum annuum]|nr:putative dynein light chain, cytoplasmic-like [Capsicum annuum]
MAKNKKRGRSSATSRRLKMYNNRPKRDRKGKILKHEYQSKHLQLTRIQPDPRWFSMLPPSHIRRYKRRSYHLPGCIVQADEDEVADYCLTLSTEVSHFSLLKVIDLDDPRSGVGRIRA